MPNDDFNSNTASVEQLGVSADKKGISGLTDGSWSPKDIAAIRELMELYGGVSFKEAEESYRVIIATTGTIRRRTQV